MVPLSFVSSGVALVGGPHIPDNIFACAQAGLFLQLNARTPSTIRLAATAPLRKYFVAHVRVMRGPLGPRVIDRVLA